MNCLHPVVEPLGERILYSADAVVLMPDASGMNVENLDTGDQLGAVHESTRIQTEEFSGIAPILVVLDPSLDDLDLLIADLQSQAGDQTRVDYLVLTSDQDSIEQISDALSESDESYGSLQILTHGEAGQFSLGNLSISNEFLNQNPDAFQGWQDNLTESADLLIFGCNLADTNEGVELISQLASATGADVAASDDTTGHVALGGDWTLEAETGSIESSLVFAAATTDQWLSTLDVNTVSVPDQVNATLTGTQQFDNTTGARLIATNGSSVVVVWTDTSTSNISFQRYDTSGVKLGSELAIANPLGVVRQSPAISMNASGEFIITWTSDAQDGDNGGIYAQRFQADGTPYGRPAASLAGTYSNPNEFRINRETASDQRTPDVGLYDDGQFIITWRSLDNISGDTTTNIRYATFNSAGTHVSTADEFASTDTTTDQSAPVIAVENTNGTAVIAFEMEDAANNDPIGFVKIGANGAASGGVTSTGSGLSNAYRPSISMNDSGRFVVGWDVTALGLDQSFLKVYSSDLTAFSTKRVAPFALTDLSNGKVDIDDQGNLVGVWQNRASGNFDIYARQFDAEGTAIGAPLLIGTDNVGQQITPDVVIHGATASTVYAGESIIDAAGIVLSTFDFSPVGAVVTLPTPQETAEGGSVVDIQLALRSLPLGDVTVSASVSDASEAFLPLISRTYNAGNWSTVLPYQVLPVDDALLDGDIPYTVTFSFTSAADANYDALPNLIYEFVNLDNEAASTPVGPVTDIDSTTNQIPEDDAGNTAVGVTAQATDANSGDSVAYSITSDSSGNFVVDSSTGIISTNGSPSLNFENASQHVVRVRATSSDTSFTELDVTIAVTDVNEPLVSQVDSDPSLNQLSELSPALTPVGITAFSADQDSGDTVNYAMLSDPSGKFGVDPVSGLIRLRTGVTLDAATSPTHTVVVRATSSDTSSVDQSYLIQVTSAPPLPIGNITDVDGTANEVAENSTTRTSVGYTAAAVDPNSGDSVSYSITADQSGFFQIDSATGVVTIAPGASANFENATQHAIQIQALSTDGSTSSSSPVINVLDVNEALTITSNGGGSSANIQLANNVQDVTFVQATDPESVAPTYSISGGADAGQFSIDSASGLLTFNSTPDVGSPSDVNADSIYEVSVQASDGLNLTSQNLRIGVAVNPAGASIGPVSDSDGSANQVDENSAVGTHVGATANATDSDLADTVSYAIVSDPSSNFQIDAITGVISVAAGNSLNFESSTQHTVRVRASSTDASFGEADFLIQVNNLPETPVITSNGGGSSADITLPDGETNVTTVQATDPDLQGIGYSIIGGSDASRLTIDSSTGALTFNNPPDLSNPSDSNLNSVYLVDVRASDGTRFDDQTLRIGVGVHPASPDAGWSGSVLLNEDEQIVLNNAMLFIDPSNASTLRIDLSIEAGTFTLGQIGGLTFLEGSGSSDSSMSFTGSPADVTAALAQVTYRPRPNDSNNPLANFTVSDASDPTKFDLALNRFQIAPINDAPTIGGTLSAQSTNDRSVVIDTSILNANDLETPSSSALIYTVQSTPAAGSLTLNGSTLSIGQTFTQADVVAGALDYSANETTETQDSFAVTVSDPQGAISPATSVAIQRLTIDEAVTPDPEPEPEPGPGPGPGDLNNGNDSGQENESSNDSNEMSGGESDNNEATGEHPVDVSVPGAPYSRVDQNDQNPASSLSELADPALVSDDGPVLATRGSALSFAAYYENPPHEFNQTRYELPVSDVVVQRDYRIDQIGFKNSMFQRSLASLQKDFDLASESERSVVASSFAVSSGLSIGYVLWLLRSGALLSSVLASIPAWRSIDPLPILSSMPAADGQGGDDDDSLESMLAKADEQRQNTQEQVATPEPTDS